MPETTNREYRNSEDRGVANTDYQPQLALLNTQRILASRLLRGGIYAIFLLVSLVLAVFVLYPNEFQSAWESALSLIDNVQTFDLLLFVGALLSLAYLYILLLFLAVLTIWRSMKVSVDTNESLSRGVVDDKIVELVGRNERRLDNLSSWLKVIIYAGGFNPAIIITLYFLSNVPFIGSIVIDISESFAPLILLLLVFGGSFILTIYSLIEFT